MPELPDPNLKPEEVDYLVKSYGKPLAPERKEALMDTLRKEALKMEELNQSPTPPKQDRGRSGR